MWVGAGGGGVVVKLRPCRGGQENPGEAPISPKGPSGHVNQALKCDRCHCPGALAESEYDFQASFCEEVNVLLLRIGMCVHMRTKTIGRSSPVPQTGAARGRHPLPKVPDAS